MHLNVYPMASGQGRIDGLLLLFFSLEVSVSSSQQVATFIENAANFLRYYNASVTAPSTPKGNSQLGFTFVHIGWIKKFEQRTKTFQELRSGRLAEHIISNALLQTGFRTQVLNPVRIGEKPAVDH